MISLVRGNWFREVGAMRHHLAYVVAVGAVLSAAVGWAFLRDANTGADMTQAAEAFVESLTAEQKATAVLPADSPLRVDWHFIPKDQRKGLQIKHMNDAQRKAALALLRSALSQIGYDKATKIMALEGILRELEKGRTGGAIRDPERYYYTVFGEPSDLGRWALSIEGHHLSLNFVVDKGKVIASTPTFFAANPNVVREGMPGGVPAGTRVLADEELLAFQLTESLGPEQRKTAITADKAPREIRAAGELPPPAYAPEGLSFAGLNGTQQQLLRQLIAVYARNLPADLASARLQAIDGAGYDRVYFAWAGADRPGIGHYYRIQGPTFLIEFVNTQPDSAGNPASHIHSVWRDPTGDFAIPAKRS
jgi:hypothetical protein